eukprot:9495988-Alexandrium_andersonii.AAC.1
MASATLRSVNPSSLLCWPTPIARARALSAAFTGLTPKRAWLPAAIGWLRPWVLRPGRRGRAPRPGRCRPSRPWPRLGTLRAAAVQPRPGAPRSLGRGDW